MRIFQMLQRPTDNLTRWDMEGKADQDPFDTAYSEFAPPGTQTLRIDNTNMRNGTRSASMEGSSVAGETFYYTYTLLAADKVFPMEISFYAYWNNLNLTPAQGESCSFSLQLYVDASNWLTLNAAFYGDPTDGRTEYGVSFSYNGAGGSGSLIHVNDAPHTSQYRGQKIVLDDVAGTVRYFTDDDNSGAWILRKTLTGITLWTPTSLRIKTGIGADTTIPYDSFYIDDVIFTPGFSTGDEIPGVIGASCSKKMKGQGMFSATIRDFELANYATYKDHVWRGYEVYKNDLAMKLGEYFCIRPQFQYNEMLFQGPEGVRILDKIATNYNGLLATGIVTDLADAYIDDDKAAFTDALLTKICLFADVVGPNIETSYPNSDSDHFKTLDDNAATPSWEDGTYTDLAVEGTDTTYRWQFKYLSAANDDLFYLKMEFEVVEGAAAVAFSLTLKAQLQKFAATYEGEIHLYDFTNTQWRKISDWDHDEYPYTYVFTDADIPAGVISDYYSGDSPPEFHVKVICGQSAATAEYVSMGSFLAELKTTFSTLFGAETTNYIVDARSATRLTFTGQTPLADGVAVDDVYRVGDYLHNILVNIFANGFSSSLILDYDDSTRADAQDFRTDKIGSVLAKYAQLEGRHYWQQRGWRVQCKSSYEPTGYSLTEADCEVDKDMQRWVITRDGSEMVRHVQVVGNGVFLEGFQNPTYPSPQSHLHTDKRISSNIIASEWVTTLLAEKDNVLETITLTIDLDGDTDFSGIDVGKTINVDLFSSTFVLTNGLITSIVYADQASGNLHATLTIEGQ